MGLEGQCGTEPPALCCLCPDPWDAKGHGGRQEATADWPAAEGAQAHVGEASLQALTPLRSPPPHLPPQLQETHRKDPQSKTCGSWHLSWWGSTAAFLCRRGDGAER